MKKNYCTAEGEYPPIKVEGPNRIYANILLQDYTGAKSEMTAVMQYQYHRIKTMEYDDDLADLFSCLAVVETQHLEMLAEMIELLGGDPKYCANNRWWAGSFIKYGYTTLERLKANLQDEYDAIEAYRQHVNMIDDCYIKAILERIIKDEEHHAYLLKEQIFKCQSRC